MNESKPMVRLLANSDVEFTAGRVRRADFVMFIADVMGIARSAKGNKPDLPASYTGMPPLKPPKISLKNQELGHRSVCQIEDSGRSAVGQSSDVLSQSAE